jgi:hypothetical protein
MQCTASLQAPCRVARLNHNHDTHTRQPTAQRLGLCTHKCIQIIAQVSAPEGPWVNRLPFRATVKGPAARYTRCPHSCTLQRQAINLFARDHS